MKSLLAIFLFVGVAWCNSTQYYAWTPNKELVYRFESQVLTGIPEIQESHKSGVRLSAEARVQAFSDYSLRIKFENSRLITVNGEVNLSEKGRINKGSETENGIQESELPSQLRSYLEKPFVAHLKRGLVQSFQVESSEPASITNLKRAFLSQIQMDITASRRGEIESNHVPLKNGLENNQVQTPLESLEEVTYFTTREETLLGDCQTSYTVHKLPKYRALELEQQWKQDEQKLFLQQQINSQGEEVCQGKDYFRITKTKNLDNCQNSPIFQRSVGFENRCDTKAACADQYTRLLSSTCIVCGELNQFVIRKCLKKGVSSQAPIGFNSEETLRTSATVSIELLKEESSFSPLPLPSDLKEKKSLIFEYPELSQQGGQWQNNRQTQESELKSVMPQPDLYTSHNLLFKTGASNKEIAQQVVEELRRVAAEVFESPESCSSKSDVAGHLVSISKYLLPLSYEELKSVKSEVLSSSSRYSESTRMVIKTLFYDVLSSVGSNPAAMLIKKDIKDQEITGRIAVNALENLLRSVRTPTQELLKELVELVKSIKHLTSSKNLYSVALVQVSNLMYRACVHPVRSMTEFPVRIYGQFCSNESRVITEQWIPLLESEIESSRSQNDDHLRLVAITALGKVGHIKALQTLSKVIEGHYSQRPLVRSVAVYSLKRMAKLNPVLLRPVILSVIDNPADNAEVRIAAVSVLPWSQPTAAELQKIAVRTWFEPSKQVASFIHSTLKNLATTEVPELKTVGLKASSIVHTVKPFEYGMQFSHNANFGHFVNYLKTAVSKKISWVNSEESFTPSRISVASNIYTGGFAARGLSYTIYTQGMDYLLDKVLYYANKNSHVSHSVKEQLEKITEELKIRQPEEKNSEMFIQARILGFERLYTINKDYVMEIIEKASEALRHNPQVLADGKSYEYARSVQVYDYQIVSPTCAGLLVYHENLVSSVYAVKGFAKAEENNKLPLPLPSKISAKAVPIMNIKAHSHVGVICPFTHQLIATGIDGAIHLSSPLETHVEIDMDEVSVTLKTPESVKKSIELFHAYITPYSAVKNMKSVQPLGKSQQLKQILSKTQMKKVEIDLGKKMGLSSKLMAETDAKYADLYQYWQKLQQHNFASLLNTGLIPSTVRRSSLKIIYNPTESETKELTWHFHWAKGIRNQQNQEQELEQAEDKLIQKVCKQNYRQHSYEYEQCQQQLKNINVISREAEEACQNQVFNHEVERMRCRKAAEICHKAAKICESHHNVQSSRCQEKRESCENHVQNNHALRQMLQKMEQNSKLNRIQVHASLKGRHNKNSLKTALNFGSVVEQENEQRRVVKNFASGELELPQRSAQYEIILESRNVYPNIQNRWNTQQLVNEDIKVEVEGKIKFGRKNSLKEIVFKTSMEKSQEQKQSVRDSAEFARCVELEQKNKVLSPICMKVRHQAASLDKIVLSVEVPEELRQSSSLAKIEDYLKSYFISQIKTEQESSVSSPRKIQFILDISRAGDEAQLKVERAGEKITVQNIRLPKALYGILPLSIRNQVNSRIMQKLTHNQAPASCRIEPEYIGTFDNKTIHYQLNDCNHLLFKDRSGRVPVAILARSQSGSQSASKVVEILSGMTRVVLRPKSASQAQGMEVEVKINDEKKTIELQQGQTHMEKSPVSGETLIVVKRYADNVYSIVVKREMLQVITDGLRIEIVAPQIVRGRTCGLCGDFNGENTAELMTPQQCIMGKSRFFAYSYMLQEGQQCSGIPSQDRDQYEKELNQCAKKEEIITPLKNIVNRIHSLANPTVSVHVVKKQANQVCISKQKVKICAEKLQNQEQTKNFLQGKAPVEVKAKTLQFTCLARPSQQALNLERRAVRGDNLQVELARLPVHFTNVEYEPVLCQQQQQNNLQNNLEENLQNNLQNNFPDF